MKLSELIPTADQLKLVQGVERQLLRRRRAGTLGGVIAIAWAAIQILISVVNKKYLQNIDEFVRNLVSGQWGELVGGAQGLSLYELAGILVLTAAIVTYLLLRWTSFLQKEAEGPFRYTFFIDPFQPVADTPAKRFTLKEDDRFHLLDHDLMERLNQRIQRFSLLDLKSSEQNSTAKAGSNSERNLTSHIHIEGHYAIREETVGKWVIHVMPRVRIGPSNRPVTLAYPVKLPLGEGAREADRVGSKTKRETREDVGEEALDADQYNQLVERIYSSVATEVYKQIKSDVREKIALFPSNYLRAVALFHEAKDFERSNTIDAYDYAIELYRESKRYFDIANIKWLSRSLAAIPLLWRMERKFLHMEARTRIGYSRCMIYRRVISALSGRSKNPLFEIRGQIEKGIDSLEKLHKKLRKIPIWTRLGPKGSTGDNKSEVRRKRQKRLNALMAFMTHPKDSMLRRNQPLSERLRESLFDAHVVAALTYYYLDSPEKAQDHLDDAESVAPDLSVGDPLYLLAAAEIEPDLSKEIFLFQQAADRAPDFEIAQYRLAYYSEMRFRAQNEITMARAGSVIKEYDEVLRINPGNIASLAAQGYLLWLLRSKKKAKKKFEEGCAIKAIVRQTFIGELNYGLARIAAEEGRFNTSYDLYREAISADPGVGAYSATAGKSVTTSYYNYIGSAMLKRRYEPFKENVVAEIEKYVRKIKKPGRSVDGAGVLDKENKEVSLRTLDVVRSFVLNDYGNACLNYFHRFGDFGELENAIRAFDEAKGLARENAVAYYNLANAYEWRRESSDKIAELLEKAERLAPAWPVVLVASAQSRLRSGEEEINKMYGEAATEIEEAEKTLTDLKNIENLLARPREKGIIEVSQAEPTKKVMQAVPMSFEVQEKELRMLQGKGELREKYRKHVKKAIEGYDEAKGRSEGHVKDVLPKVNQIVKRTKLSSMFEGLEFNVNGKGVDKLLSTRIERDRLDENDVEALRVWAQVLSNNYLAEKAFIAAEELANYILVNYYPDNYDLNMILRSMYRRKRDLYMRKDLDYWPKLELEGPDKETGLRLMMQWVTTKKDEKKYKKKIEECDEKINRFNEIIKPTIKNWLDKDPIHYASLVWTPEFFEAEDLVTFSERAIEELAKAKLPPVAIYHAILGDAYRQLKKWEEAEKAYLEAIAIEPHNAGYQNMLGNIYFESGDSARSIDPYKRAIEIDPELAVYIANLGGAYRKLGEWDGAEKAYRDAIEIESENAEYQNLLGNIYFESGDFAKSIDPYKQAIEIEPKLAVYHANLGGSFRDLEQWEEAEKAYREALEIEPDNAGYRNMLGIVYHRQGDYGKAIQSYKEAIQKGPKVGVHHANLVLAYKESGKNEETDRAFLEAVEIEPDDPVYQNEVGNAFSANGDYERAIVCYKKAIEKAPDVAFYHANLGGSLRALKKWEEAEKAYREGVKFQPKNAEYQNMLGNIYFESGDFAKSIDPYKEAIEIDPKLPVYHANLGGAYRNLREWDRAEKAYRKAISIEPKNAEYQNMLGNIYYGSGDFAKSIKLYKKAIEIDPKLAVYHANLGVAFKDSNQLKEAEKAYREALKLEPDNGSYQNMLGIVYYRQGHNQKAINRYKKAIAIEPKAAVHHANLVLAYVSSGKGDEAKEVFRDAIAVQPDDPNYQNELAKAFFGNFDYERAIVCYRKAIEKAPEVATYHANLGSSYRALTQWKEAEKANREAVRLEPKNAGYQNMLGVVYFERGDFAKSIGPYKNAIGIDPKMAVYHANLGDAFRGLGKWDEAEKAYREAIKLEPDNANYHNMLGIVYYGRGDYQKAIKSYKEAIAKAPTMPIYHANLVLAYTESGRIGKAEKAYREAVDIEPDHPVYQNELGNAFFANRDYERAIACYRKAIEKAPKVAVHHANLGNAFAMIGKWQEGEGAYLEALELEPDRAEYHDMLGDLYHKSGDFEKAAEEYGKAVRLAPEVQLYTTKLEQTGTQIEDPDKARSLLEPLSLYNHNKDDLTNSSQD
jgi:tetratricopeptide (TPR) repeat protein